jgi:5-methylcytosine-specific restriction protein A
MADATADRRPPPWTWDELVLACDLVVKNRSLLWAVVGKPPKGSWRALTADDRRVLELSNLLQILPIHPPEVRGSKFRNPNGVARKTVDLATNHPDYSGARTNGGRLDRSVIKAFIEDPDGMAETADAIRAAAAAGRTAGPLLDLDLDIDTDAYEGRVLLRLHLMRERDPKLRARKIKDVRKRLSCVRCEVCSFDFESTYGSRGRDYIECHHRTPLSHSGQTRTSLVDLALLCSNCHRMIHRYRPWLTVEQLRSLINHQ